MPPTLLQPKCASHEFGPLPRLAQSLEEPARLACPNNQRPHWPPARLPTAATADHEPPIPLDPQGSKCPEGSSSPPQDPPSLPAIEDARHRVHTCERSARNWLHRESPTAALRCHRTASASQWAANASQTEHCVHGQPRFAPTSSARARMHRSTMVRNTQTVEHEQRTWTVPKLSIATSLIVSRCSNWGRRLGPLNPTRCATTWASISRKEDARALFDSMYRSSQA